MRKLLVATAAVAALSAFGLTANAGQHAKNVLNIGAVDNSGCSCDTNVVANVSQLAVAQGGYYSWNSVEASVEQKIVVTKGGEITVGGD